jgi:hypothetical protein
VIVVAVVKRGVTPFDTTMFGVTVPLYRILPVPEPVSVPTAKCVSVSDPPVACGKSMFATGLELCELAAVHPPVVRATETRAYDVYAASLVV